MVEAAIFDVDGTLVDSVDQHAKSWKLAFEQYGHIIPYPEIRSQIGKGGDQLLPVFLSPGELKQNGAAIEKARGKIFKEEFMPTVRPFSGVRALFERLRERGIPVALASSAPPDELDYYKKLAEIGDLTDESTSAEDAGKSKPHPDVFEAALRHLNNPKPKRTVVVGDSPYDAEAASKLKLIIVAVLCGGFPEADLRAAGAEAVYRDPMDLLVHFEDIFG